MFIFTSWLPLLLLILLFLLPLLLLLLLLQRNEKSSFSPGPPRLAVIGNFHQLGRLPHRTLCQLSKKYGPVMYLKLGSKPALVVSSAKLASEVIKTQDLDFCNRPTFLSYKKLSCDSLDVAFATYGDHHREMRKTMHNELLSVTESSLSGSSGMKRLLE